MVLSKVFFKDILKTKRQFKKLTEYCQFLDLSVSPSVYQIENEKLGIRMLPLGEYQLTWQDIGIRTEENTETGLVVDRLARVVSLARFKTIREH